MRRARSDCVHDEENSDDDDGSESADEASRYQDLAGDTRLSLLSQKNETEEVKRRRLCLY
jgi:hypothetical protein